MSQATTIDPRALRDCCGSFATGVTVVTTRTAQGDHGTTVSAFMSVSLEPPLICISLDRRSRMVERLEDSGRFAVNILRKSMQAHALHFGGWPDDSLSDLFVDHEGLPLLREAAAVIVAAVEQKIEAGDHFLFLGRVTHLERDPNAIPLLHHAGQFAGLDGKDLD